MMIRLLILLALYIPAIAQARWVQVVETSNEIIYIDVPLPPQSTTPHIKASLLFNFKRVQEYDTRSMISHQVFDCMVPRMKMLENTAHNTQMAVGNPVNIYALPLNEQIWIPIENNTAGSTIRDVVCALGQ